MSPNVTNLELFKWILISISSININPIYGASLAHFCPNSDTPCDTKILTEQMWPGFHSITKILTVANAMILIVLTSFWHSPSANTSSHRKKTKMAGYTWAKEDAGIYLENVKWQILRKFKKYTPGSRMRDVCLSEKLAIMENKKHNSINQRNETNEPMHSPVTQDTVVSQEEINPANSRGWGRKQF